MVTAPDKPAGIAPVTLLAGREQSLRDEALGALRARLFKSKDSEDLNLHVFEFPTDPLEEALTVSATAPFLAERRLLVIRGAGNLAAAEDKKALLARLARPAATAVWVLMVDEKIPYDRDNKARSDFLKALWPLCFVVTCEAPSWPSELKVWIRKRFTAAGVAADEAAVSDILDRVGKSLTLLGTAVDQLCLYAAERRRVGPADVAALLGDSAEKSAFEIYEALKLGRFSDALRILRRLESEGKTPQETAGALAWQCDRVLRIKNFLARGLGLADAAAKLRMKEFAVKKAAEAGRRLTPEQLESDLEALNSCQADIKHGRLRADLALEKCLLSLNQA